eukprot:Sspe_Gene.59946::Locus_32970_Transcript_2_4_Confidence_0.400_Length_1258::g.59946::m.59946/K01011/TST, MPST, sseA; thiosulfate/3-mercaptopyruvate sulfurtransferase
MPTVEIVQGTLEACGVTSDSHVVLYSQTHPMWATRAWWVLAALGCRAEVSVLNGGLQSWAAEGLPTEEGWVERPQHCGSLAFSGGACQERVVGVEEVLEAVRDPRAAVACALSRQFFEGGDDSYGKAGCIPGTLSLPHSWLVDPAKHHTFLPTPEIAAAFAEAGLSAPPAKGFYTYCGAGISATVPLFAARALLGWECPLVLYDGSMAEYCARSLPLQVGAVVSGTVGA